MTREIVKSIHDQRDKLCVDIDEILNEIYSSAFTKEKDIVAGDFTSDNEVLVHVIIDVDNSEEEGFRLQTDIDQLNQNSCRRPKANRKTSSYNDNGSRKLSQSAPEMREKLKLGECINGDITMTQSPPALSVELGQTATITCTVSEDISSYLAWYQQREGRENSQPKLTLLPPSPEQVNAKSTATLVCLANHFYPDELEVQWKKDGAVISDGVQTSNYLRASDSTYSVSSLLTLSGSDWESNACFSCALTHVTLPSPLSKSIRRSECV
ncbi:immunoglobulin kappa light chain-like [Chiloscyllium punctatum]|uniref:immunoglobulin kappa light chain-like n=1 Tax=Chiloscyllium punctatum TaxID=137246 RepID=UPI003B6368FF